MNNTEKLFSFSLGNNTEMSCDMFMQYNNVPVFMSLIGIESHAKVVSMLIKNNKKINSNAYVNGRYYSIPQSKEFNYNVISKKSVNDYVHTIIYLDDTYSISGNNESYRSYIITNKPENIVNELYKRLKRYSSIPILEEWMPFIFTKLLETNCLKELEGYKYMSNNIDNDMIGYVLTADKNTILSIVQEGLRHEDINIPNASREITSILNECRGLDSYLSTFGEGLARKIQNSFKPKYEPGIQPYDTYVNNIDDYIYYHAGKNLFEAQRSVIQAVVNNMKINSSTILCGEMGVGKTIITGAACYAHNADKNHGFNALVMCPSHLVQNWKREMEGHIPNAKVYIVHNTDELLEIKDKLLDPYKVENTFVVISKEWAKIGYTYRPAAVFKRIGKYKNENNIEIIARDVFTCPECGQVLTKTITVKNEYGRKFKRIVPLEITDFTKQNKDNQICENELQIWDSKEECYMTKKCGCKLWTALNRDDDTNDWIKLGKSGWVMKRHIQPLMDKLLSIEKPTRQQSEMITQLIEQYNLLQNGKNLAIHYKGSKKYPMAKYIKERMNGVFDYFIADEMHKLKGETTGQGQAFHYLIKGCKKTIGLTGTLLNGMANSIYYLLFRLTPDIMVNEGFKYVDEQEFSRIYGVYSTTTTTTTEGVRVSNRTKLLPGISSLVFTKFLLNNTVFLSLEDMTEGLPNYTEIPRAVRLDDAQVEGYKLYEQMLQTVAINRDQTKHLSGVFRDMVSYPDAPHSATNLYDKDTQELIFSPQILEETIRPKDVELINIINEKIQLGEKVLVYYKDVNKTNLGSHIVNLIKDIGYEASELKASVKAEKREEHINKLIDNGLDVLVCNPALVETGLNLLDFTTIVFYQLGYDLSTMRQASRRSWRLSQTHDIEVYFLYYERTVQEDILSLMATKLHAAQTIEGKVTEEGLRAMSNNQDMLSQIAENVVDGIKNTVDSTLFQSSNFVRIVANTEREHYKTEDRILVDMSNNGRRVIGSIYRSKDKEYIDKNILNLFI